MTVVSNLEIQAYWDSVVQKVNPDNTQQLTYNWWKRNGIAKRLLDYEFTRKSVLDIGCGLGLSMFMVNSIAGPVRYIGVDISPETCRKARKLFGVDVRQGTATDLPVKGCKFDYVLFFDVLEHIKPTCLPQVSVQVKEILAKNGRVIINNPITESRHNPAFDFGFDDEAIGKFTMDLGLRIEKLDRYSVRDYTYQFIVLS